MVQAIWNGQVIADSDATIMVEGNHYFAPASVNQAALKPSATTSRCPWKGTARYHTILVGGKQNADAAWYYPDPLEKASNIKDHVAFWKGVEIKE